MNCYLSGNEDFEPEIDSTDRVNGKPVRVYPYQIPRSSWTPTTDLQNWMRSLNSLLQQHDLAQAFSDEQIKNSSDEIVDIGTEFQLNAECAFRGGLSVEEFLVQEMGLK